MRKIIRSNGRLILILACAAPAIAQHGGDLWIAVSSTGQLKLSPLGFRPEKTIVSLDPAGGLFPGWTGEAPGFDDLGNPDPANDAYPLANGADISIEVVSLDAALLAWTTQLQPIQLPGERAFLGTVPPGIHTHLIWHIDSSDPLFDPARHVWSAQFQLVDLGSTAYQPSAPFRMGFTNLDCRLGDVNRDGRLDNEDIDPFVRVLVNPSVASREERCAADINMSGAVDNEDIDPFVALLLR